MQLNQQPKRKFDDYTAAAYPQGAVLDTDALQALSPQHPHHSHALGHPALAQYQLQQQHHLQQQLANRSLHQVPLQAPVRAYVGPDNGSSTSPPQPPVAGKEKKPRKKREKTEKAEKPRKSRKSKGKVEESKPKVLFRGSRFELWLETRFEEELLKLFSVPVLEFSANLVANGASSSSAAGAGSWAMARSGEERIYKEKWRKRYHVYSAEVADLVADDFNFHIRIKNASGDFMKLPFISPDKIPTSPVSSFSNYLSLLGGAHISPGDDHCGYPPGELAGEDACTLYEGSDVSYVLVGHLVGQPAAPAGLHPFNVSHAAAPPLTHLSSQHHNQHATQQQQQQQQHPSHHAAALHAVGGGYPPPPHHHHHPHQLPTDGNHP